MAIIKELGNAIHFIDHERISIFCFTLIIISLLIWWNNYSTSIIFFCFSMILHFFFISFYYYKTSYTDKDGKIITISEYKLPSRNEPIHKPLKFIGHISIVLLILSIISFIIESYIQLSSIL